MLRKSNLHRSRSGSLVPLGESKERASVFVGFFILSLGYRISHPLAAFSYQGLPLPLCLEAALAAPGVSVRVAAAFRGGAESGDVSGALWASEVGGRWALAPRETIGASRAGAEGCGLWPPPPRPGPSVPHCRGSELGPD